MAKSTNVSMRVYGLLLLLYPRELRLRFGEEMTRVFADQLAAARHERNALEVMKVWQQTIAELFTVALPSQLADMMIIVPVLSFLSALALFLALSWGLTAHQAIPHFFQH